MSWLVINKRDAETLQPLIDHAPPAFQYCTDGLSSYDALNYHRGLHLVAEGKTQTYSVEAGNAELRHYLSRLAKRSRCFSKSLQALRQAIELFVRAWNARQIFKQRFPSYSPPLRDFACAMV